MYYGISTSTRTDLIYLSFLRKCRLILNYLTKIESENQVKKGLSDITFIEI